MPLEGVSGANSFFLLISKRYSNDLLYNKRVGHFILGMLKNRDSVNSYATLFPAFAPPYLLFSYFFTNAHWLSDANRTYVCSK